MGERIYLDNAATTKVSEEVLQEMLPYFRETYANPSAIYSFAGEAKKAVGIARERAARGHLECARHRGLWDGGGSGGRDHAGESGKGNGSAGLSD